MASSGCQCGEQMLLSGWFELTIDSKNRVSIPHPCRAKLNADTDGRSFYVLPGHRRGTLAIYPDRYFESLRHRPPPPSNAEIVHEWRQFEFSQTFLIDPDSQGRILIPERLLKRAGIGKEVTLIGVEADEPAVDLPSAAAAQLGREELPVDVGTPEPYSNDRPPVRA